MKHLLLFFLFSGSLGGFSQVSQFAICYHNTPACKCSSGEVVMRDTAIRRTPDTLRATLIVYYDNGPAILHTKPGFVVTGEREVYLDDKKKVIKAPWEVLTYKIKK